MTPDLAAIRELSKAVLNENIVPSRISLLNLAECTPTLLAHIDSLEAAVRELRDKWERQATESREEAGRIRRTIKDPTDAEERCNVRAEVWEWCSAELTARLAALGLDK